MNKIFNLQSIVRENIKNIKPYSSARDEYKDATAKETIFLDANESPFNNGVNRYPDPHQNRLKEKLSEIKGVSKENMLLGNGSDEVLDLLFRAFCEPKKDNIITLPPTYGMYKVLAAINDIENKEVFLSADFQINTQQVLQAFTANSRILFLCTPNNPTGTNFFKKDIEELLENFNGLVVIDEAYIDFSSEQSWLEKLEEYPNLVVIQTLSKAYGMAAIRLGICYASKEIIKILNNIKPPYNVNELTQQKALERLHYLDEIENEVNQLISERKRVAKELTAHIDYIEKVYPSEGNFLLIKVDNATKRYQQLLEYGVVVRNRSNLPLCDNCLRISIGISEENQKLIRALKAIQ